MTKIPKFKDHEEERKFWESHSLADYVDDTQKIEIIKEPRKKDTNVTRHTRWPLQVYLTPEEGLCLEEFAQRTGESRNTIVRQALRRYMASKSPATPIDPRAVVLSYLQGIDLGPTEKVVYLHVEFTSHGPKRDLDLARKLKSMLQVAYPSARVVEVVIRKDETYDLVITKEVEVGGRLTKAEIKTVDQAVQEIAERTIGQQFRSRHPIKPMSRATNE